jgi:hypothetical protein
VLRYDGTSWINSNEFTFAEKTGTWVAGPTDASGTGLLNTVNIATVDPASDVNDPTYGHARKIGNNGINTNTMGINQTTSFYRRQWNTRMIAKVNISSQIPNTHVWIGFSSSPFNLSGDNALANLLAYWQVYSVYQQVYLPKTT